jgi:hypothetical protein
MTKRDDSLTIARGFIACGGPGVALLKNEAGVKRAVAEALAGVAPKGVEPGRLARLSAEPPDFGGSCPLFP